MALKASALSIVADNLAALLAQHFTDQGEDVLVSVDTPAAAAKRADAGATKHSVNLFFYSVAPSGFRAWSGVGDPLFLRLFCMVTPFPTKSDAAHPEADADLRLLGTVIRFLNCTPTLPSGGAWPSPAAAGDTAYRVDAILLAPNMEEINHIWTTQGTELPYRLSAAYEFAIVPVDPLVAATIGPPVREAMIQVDPNVTAATDVASVPHTPYSTESRIMPLVPPAGQPPLAASWAPLALFVDGDRLTNTLHVPAAGATAPMALAGLPGGKARLTLTWFDNTGTAVGAPSVVVRDVGTGRLDVPAARFNLALAPPATGVHLRVDPTPAASDGSALPGALSGTALDLFRDGV
jgi:hypothetical protein